LPSNVPKLSLMLRLGSLSKPFIFVLLLLPVGENGDRDVAIDTMREWRESMKCGSKANAFSEADYCFDDSDPAEKDDVFETSRSFQSLKIKSP
jgi:hypothetical protein